VVGVSKEVLGVSHGIAQVGTGVVAGSPRCFRERLRFLGVFLLSR